MATPRGIYERIVTAHQFPDPRDDNTRDLILNHLTPNSWVNYLVVQDLLRIYQKHDPTFGFAVSGDGKLSNKNQVEIIKGLIRFLHNPKARKFFLVIIVHSHYHLATYDSTTKVWVCQDTLNHTDSVAQEYVASLFTDWEQNTQIKQTVDRYFAKHDPSKPTQPQQYKYVFRDFRSVKTIPQGDANSCGLGALALIDEALNPTDRRFAYTPAHFNIYRVVHALQILSNRVDDYTYLMTPEEIQALTTDHIPPRPRNIRCIHCGMYATLVCEQCNAAFCDPHAKLHTLVLNNVCTPRHLKENEGFCVYPDLKCGICRTPSKITFCKQCACTYCKDCARLDEGHRHENENKFRVAVLGTYSDVRLKAKNDRQEYADEIMDFIGRLSQSIDHAPTGHLLSDTGIFAFMFGRVITNESLPPLNQSYPLPNNVIKNLKKKLKEEVI